MWVLSPNHFEHMFEFSRDAKLGFFHVTSHAYDLEKSGHYLSRFDLVDRGIQGLGGAMSDSGNKVSFVPELDRAMRLLAAIRSVSRAIHHGLPASELLVNLLDWTGFPDDGWQSAMKVVFGEDDDETISMDRFAHNFFEKLLDVIKVPRRKILEMRKDDGFKSLTLPSGWYELIETHGKYIDHNLSKPEEKYEFVQDFERIIQDGLASEYEDPFYEQRGFCVPLALFVAPYAQFKKVQPDNVSVTQAAVKEDAIVETVASECEFRFLPKDVKLVAVRVEERGPVREDRLSWKST